MTTNTQFWVQQELNFSSGALTEDPGSYPK